MGTACGFVFWAIIWTATYGDAANPTSQTNVAIESFDTAKECRAYDAQFAPKTRGIQQKDGKTTLYVCLPAGMKP